MPLSRSSIQRSDFPTGRRGYDPAAVDAHLSAVADQVEALQRGASQPVAAAASEQVQRIVEAAERTAEQLRSEAGDEAREHVARVAAAAGELLEPRRRPERRPGRADGPHARGRRPPVGGAALARARGGRVRRPRGGGARGGNPSRRPSPSRSPEPEPEPERAEDEEAARLVALDMALGGQPREETERYLAEHYRLAEPDRLLDDVYARAGQ